jgi:hypothetical protein
MAPFDLAIESWPSRFYIYIAYASFQHVPVELTLELSGIINLDYFCPKGQPG